MTIEIDNRNGCLNLIVQYSDIISKLEPVFKEIPVTVPPIPLKYEGDIQVGDVKIDYRIDNSSYTVIKNLTTTTITGYNHQGIVTQITLPSAIQFKAGKTYKITIEETV